MTFGQKMIRTFGGGMLFVVLYRAFCLAFGIELPEEVGMFFAVLATAIAFGLLSWSEKRQERNL